MKRNSYVLQTETLNKRNGFIELCRFVFAMCVVSHHFMLLPISAEHIPLIGGYIGTEFFFILSGFFLYSSAQKDTIKQTAIEQIVKKFKKVFPYFLVAWFLGFFVYFFKNQSGVLRFFWELIKGVPQLLLLSMSGMSNGQGGPNDYVGTGWYLSALMLAMLAVYPLMRKYGEQFAGAYAPLISAFCYGYFMIFNGGVGVVNQHIGFCYLGIFRAIAGLCFGSFCYFLCSKIKGAVLTQIGNTIVSFLQIALIAVSLLLMEWYIGHNDAVQIIIFGCLIIISLGLDTSVNRFFTNSISIFLGKFSMAIFLSQSMTYMYGSGILPYPEYWPLRYFIHIGYVLGASIIVYFIVEILGQITLSSKLKRLLIKAKDSST